MPSPELLTAACLVLSVPVVCSKLESTIAGGIPQQACLHEFNEMVTRIRRDTISEIEVGEEMKNTKDKILARGVDLLSESGFAQVTVGLLAQRTGMSKSGLFAHFGSKEEVQLGLLEETVRISLTCFVEPAMQNAPGLGRLRALVYGWLGWTGKAGLSGGCPVAAGLFELDDVAKSDPRTAKTAFLRGAVARVAGYHNKGGSCYARFRDEPRYRSVRLGALRDIPESSRV